jgi:Holliday junction resolvase-like predicted endonuclease
VHTEPEIKLLELTKHERRLSLHDLADALHTVEPNIESKIQALSKQGYVTFSGGIVEAEKDQRMMLAERLIQNGHDPDHIARLLDWQEFEDFAVESLKQNGFQAVKHLVFKSRRGRREIDLLAWSDNFALSVDCKHWLRGLSPSSARATAMAQIERTIALSERPDLLIRRGFVNPVKRKILPVVISLSDPRERIVEGVPVVAVSKLLSFLYGISPVDERFRMIAVRALPEQALFL